MDEVATLVSQYRMLKAQADELSAKMDNIKAQVKPLVEDGGNWQDDAGYAKLIRRSASTSFDAKAVSNLINAWAMSEDPIMRSCGDMLRVTEKHTPASEYLSIK